VPPAPDGATLPPFGRLGALDLQPAGSGVQCHVCGRHFANLAQHARLAHRLWADDYRERFGLNRGTALVAPSLSALHAALARAHDQGRSLTPIRVRPGDPRPPHRLEGRQRRQ
jgi:hypothetical protein